VNFADEPDKLETIYLSVSGFNFWNAKYTGDHEYYRKLNNTILDKNKGELIIRELDKENPYFYIEIEPQRRPIFRYGVTVILSKQKEIITLTFDVYPYTYPAYMTISYFEEQK
jgi:hypothetical protein